MESLQGDLNSVKQTLTVFTTIVQLQQLQQIGGMNVIPREKKKAVEDLQIKLNGVVTSCENIQRKTKRKDKQPKDKHKDKQHRDKQHRDKHMDKHMDKQNDRRKARQHEFKDHKDKRNDKRKARDEQKRVLHVMIDLRSKQLKVTNASR
ncbi:uncharacterized protein K452DRAFT_316089 [Aplosporella prunicola CBS 121167]|uniref:Uncharacterized protein n=1 Tax=Aplosporella prunicola CBS 121167 TaxID=1176127 RepID=A0A6A6BMQ4_9PEZI|nr:uncharacterized protein K452DRAFT_316089 [Aplosporella prunicola CBS 121167]KAF2144948.1 hypothetical protein K452DRAFT_316089 [Aplosporella prunicola CBS 121167]